MEICRICSESSHYDIFNNELMFEHKKTIKIYIILNNFLYEKLYGPDEFSSYICENCCESLFNSYKFMEEVRKSELQLRVSPPQKKMKKALEEISKPSDEARLDLEEEETIQDSIAFDDDSFIPEEVIEMPFQDEALVEDPKPTEELKETSEPSVTFIDYVLEHKEENGQKCVTVRVDRKKVKIRKKYEFNVISHSDSNSIYSCQYCVKAFGNLDFLMKHLSLCHLCTFCLAVKDTYNELNEHLKESHKDQLKCPFCTISLNLKAFRPHIKKNHVTNLPNYYSIIAE